MELNATEYGMQFRIVLPGMDGIYQYADHPLPNESAMMLQ